MTYYREPDVGYMAVAGAREGLPPRVTPQGEVVYEARAAAIAGLPNSVCTTSVSKEYLKECKRVRKAEVPKAWLRRF